MDLIEIAWIAIPTLFKLFAASEAGARDLCLRTLKMIENLEYRDVRLSVLRAKLHLFLASLYLREKNEDINTLLNINSELSYVSKMEQEIQKDEFSMSLSHHVTFTKAYVYYKIRKGRFLQQEKGDKKKHLMKKSEEIMQMLKQCEDFLAPLDASYDVERCKLTILISKIILKNLKARKVLKARLLTRLKSLLEFSMFTV